MKARFELNTRRLYTNITDSSMYTGSQKELIMTVFMLPGNRWKSAKKVLHKRTFSHAKNESSVVLHM